MNSREKGKRGERQWRDELRAHGFTARRGQQFAGGTESPDVICSELDWIHFEVKAVERLNIEEAMQQARRDCFEEERKSGKREIGNHLAPALSPDGGEGENMRPRKVPIVAHKRNFCSWLVTMDAETFFTLLRSETGNSR